MPSLHYASSAEIDLEEIADYTIRTWGRLQSASYIDDLQTCCEMIAANPLLGRPCEQLATGLHRIEQRKHVIFYRLEAVVSSSSASSPNADSHTSPPPSHPTPPALP